MMISKWTLFLLSISILITVSVSPAYAQHHSGALAPPVDFGGMQVALTSVLTPEDFTFEEGSSANLLVRFFDSTTNTSIKSVTYRVQIFQGDNLVANEYFYDEEGNLDLEIKPTKGCLEKDLWKCTKYFGEKHAIAGAYFGRGDSRPVIQGPVFDKSGPYDIKVSIVGATNPKTMTAADLYFETFLSIPEKQDFLIQTVDAQEFPVIIKSYEGEVLNFNFDANTNKISYEVSFHKDHSGKHEAQIKQIVRLEKDFSGFKENHSVEVFVEGTKVPKTFLLDSSAADKNTIRIDMHHKDLQGILEKSNVVHEKDNLKIEIVPGKQIHLSQLDYSFENGYGATVTWNSDSVTGDETPFKFSFFDASKMPVNGALYAYSISDSLGKEIWSNIGGSESFLGIVAVDGTNEETITIPNTGSYQIKLILTGENSRNYEKFFTATDDFEIIKKPQVTKNTDNVDTAAVPQVAGDIAPWIKNNAGWWAEGIVGDDEFVNSIQFLINEGIIMIPDIGVKSSGSGEIPSWVKSNAGWWADGLISDSDFVKGIQFLGQEGIIIIN